MNDLDWLKGDIMDSLMLYLIGGVLFTLGILLLFSNLKKNKKKHDKVKFRTWYFYQQLTDDHVKVMLVLADFYKSVDDINILCETIWRQFKISREYITLVAFYDKCSLDKEKFSGSLEAGLTFSLSDTIKYNADYMRSCGYIEKDMNDFNYYISSTKG